MSFTQGQRDEAASIANRMSLLGIESSATVLVKVLDDVKKWCNGVEAIKDLETRVCIDLSYNSPIPNTVLMLYY
jgi:hypothetical protein